MCMQFPLPEYLLLQLTNVMLNNRSCVDYGCITASHAMTMIVYVITLVVFTALPLSICRSV